MTAPMGRVGVCTGTEAMASQTLFLGAPYPTACKDSDLGWLVALKEHPTTGEHLGRDYLGDLAWSPRTLHAQMWRLASSMTIAEKWYNIFTSARYSLKDEGRARAEAVRTFEGMNDGSLNLVFADDSVLGIVREPTSDPAVFMNFVKWGIWTPATSPRVYNPIQD